MSTCVTLLPSFVNERFVNLVHAFLVDRYDIEESASKVSHDTASNEDDNSARDDRNDSNARQKTTNETEDDRDRFSKQHKKISLKKSTSKTYDDLPDLCTCV